MTTAPTIHFAGLEVRIGNLLRQRCAWCGLDLLDYDLTCTASPCDERCAAGCKPEHHHPATWPAGALVRVGGINPRVTVLVPHADGDPLPEGTCFDADTEHGPFRDMLIDHLSEVAAGYPAEVFTPEGTSPDSIAGTAIRERMLAEIRHLRRAEGR